MDATEAIILTSIVNIIITGLVGGIVIYTIQKKIDATIQKSLFEHQTKFVQLHAKRIETLETLYQKFRIFTFALEKLISTTNWARIKRQEINQETYKENEKNVQRALYDFWNYFNANRLYLSSELIHEIWIIYHDVGIDNATILAALDPDEMPDSHEAQLNASTKINTIANRIYSQTDKLENLYKSVAEAQ